MPKPWSSKEGSRAYEEQVKSFMICLQQALIRMDAKGVFKKNEILSPPVESVQPPDRRVGGVSRVVVHKPYLR